ncbi:MULTISPECIES: cupin domain-containing protein [Hyphomicrobiales]|uniref:cupin domain-containing protein n=1 Tax=Hyphomicrobiales TaxID=356 RepID=UPI003264FB31
MAKKIDVEAAPKSDGTVYPAPYDAPCRKRRKIKLGDAAGLTQFGVNLCRLPPGAWSSQRHWHTDEDELIYVLEGEVTLVTDDGEEILQAGDAAGFKAGDETGHCFQNRSEADVVLLEVGTRMTEGKAYYPGLDLVAVTGQGYTHRDGTPYPPEPRKT